MQPETRNKRLQSEARYYIQQLTEENIAMVLKRLEKQIKGVRNPFAFFCWLYYQKIMQIIVERCFQIPNPQLGRMVAIFHAYQGQFMKKVDNEISRKTKTILDRNNNLWRNQAINIQTQWNIFQNANKLRELAYLIFDAQNMTNIKMKMQKRNSAIKQLREIEQTTDTFEEFCCNWLRMRADQIRDGNFFVCCKSLFKKDEIVKSNNFTQHFSNYKIFPLKEEPNNFLKKQVIGFLNGKGGIIYFGFDKQQVTGIKIPPKELQNRLNEIIKQLLKGILPLHKQFLHKDSFGITNTAIGRIEVNSYISVTYQRVVDSMELLDFSNREGQFSYVIRIEVKPGHPRELYHLIKESTQNIQGFCFKNQDDDDAKIPKKLQFQDFLEKFYRKQERAENEQFDSYEFHQGCRIDLSSVYNVNDYYAQYEDDSSFDDQ